MLLYTTKFPVKENLTDEIFIQLVLEWVQNSPHYHFLNLQWNGEALVVTTDNAELEILKFEEEKMVAVHLSHRNKQQELWISNFFFSYLPGDHWVATQLSCERREGDRPVKMHLPYLLKKIQEEGYSGYDGNLPVTNVPLVLTKETMDEYSKVLFDAEIYKMPVVYISRSHDGSYAVDGTFLAKLLSGTAHVIVEEDAIAANTLIRKASGKKPYNGAVTIFYSSTNYQKFIAADLQQMSHCEEKIAQLIYQWMLQFENEERFVWHYWSAKRHEKERNRLIKKMRDDYQQQLKHEAERREQLTNELSRMQEIEEFQQIVDQILQDKDKEIQQLQEQNYRLQAQNDAMVQERERRTASSAGQPILFLGEEDDFYADEQKDIVLDILKNDLRELQGNKGNSRRKDVLESLLQSNQPGGMRQDKLDLLQEAMKKYDGMDNATRSTLKEIGFAIEEKNHYALLFYNDSRYCCTCAKTPSDRRAGVNNVKQIEKTCF